jgi:hypothetical protein
MVRGPIATPDVPANGVPSSFIPMPRSEERTDRGVAGVSEWLTEAPEGVGGHDGLRAVRQPGRQAASLAFPDRALGT